MIAIQSPHPLPTHSANVRLAHGSNAGEYNIFTSFNISLLNQPSLLRPTIFANTFLQVLGAERKASLTNKTP
jgi:hypothetical protein